MQDGRQALFQDLLFGPGGKPEGIDGSAEIGNLRRVHPVALGNFVDVTAVNLIQE